jgi:hypothetical protein
LLINGDASWKWLETRKYKELEVCTRAHEDQDTQYHDLEQEMRCLETREPSALIKTATLEIVNKSLILAPHPDSITRINWTFYWKIKNLH